MKVVFAVVCFAIGLLIGSLDKKADKFTEGYTVGRSSGFTDGYNEGSKELLACRQERQNYHDFITKIASDPECAFANPIAKPECAKGVKP